MDKSKAIDAAVSQIERQFGKGSIMRMGDEERQKVACIPTGALALGRRLIRAVVSAGDLLLPLSDSWVSRLRNGVRRDIVRPPT